MALTQLPNDAELAARVAQLAALLLERGWMMTAAESCTGGWIAKCCTDRAGSSAWFESGVVTYSNRAKSDLLGVAESVLAREGAVSEAVALAMADGARRITGAEAAVAVTGIAGPDGGSETKPVGTVWFGWSVGDRPAEAERVVYAGDREAVRRQTVAHALEGLMQRLAP